MLRIPVGYGTPGIILYEFAVLYIQMLSRKENLQYIICINDCDSLLNRKNHQSRDAICFIQSQMPIQSPPIAWGSEPGKRLVVLGQNYGAIGVALLVSMKSFYDHVIFKSVTLKKRHYTFSPIWNISLMSSYVNNVSPLHPRRRRLFYYLVVLMQHQHSVFSTAPNLLNDLHRTYD